MSDTNGTDKREQLRQARTEARLIEAELRLGQLKTLKSRRAIREQTDQWDYLSTYQDLLDRMRQPDGALLMPVSTAADRLYGANWPFWRTWTDHAKLRGMARILVGMSTQAQGAIGGLSSYVCGAGATYRA
ncbi:MAG: hypothetical protein K2R98_28275, partial [Gemmataceae bacterium]|nr:hypothetical protein [Gemmataceae bacterium]